MENELPAVHTIHYTAENTTLNCIGQIEALAATLLVFWNQKG